MSDTQLADDDKSEKNDHLNMQQLSRLTLNGENTILKEQDKFDTPTLDYLQVS
jgi:hypothetical protein